MIGAADERTGLDVTEAQFVTGAPKISELCGRNIAHDGEMARRGAEVLSESKDGNVVGAQISHDGENFVGSLAEAEHQSGFGGNRGRYGVGAGQHFERAFVTRAQADLAIEARHGFGVVIQDVGAGVHDDSHGIWTALKIGDEDFDPTTRNALAKGANGEGEQLGATILAVVTVDAGNHDIAQAHGGGSFGDTAGLVKIDGERRAFLDRAEAAAPRADVSENHKRGGATIPAIADIRAGGTFADSMQMERINERFQRAVVLANGGGGAEPLGTGKTLRLSDGDQH